MGDALTLANELLRAERLTGGELGVAWEAARQLRLRLTGYWTEIEQPDHQFHPLDAGAITRERRNLGRTRSRGARGRGRLRIGSRWRLSAGYLYADATVRTPRGPAPRGLRVPQVPRHQFTLQAASPTLAADSRPSSRALDGWQFDDDLNQLHLGSFATVDALVSRPLSRRWVSLFAAAENLLDERFDIGRTPLGTLGPPRMVRVGVRLQLGR